MFKARIVLTQTETRPLLARIEALAISLGLSSEVSSQTEGTFTRTWRSGMAGAPIEVMHSTTDERIGCVYLEFFGSEQEAVVDAVSQAYATLPARMPRDLVQEAIDSWRDSPQRLQCAALAVTGDTALELSNAILQALQESDPQTWAAAAGAAALMPAPDARRILSQALSSESSEDRRTLLSRLTQFVDGQAGNTA